MQFKTMLAVTLAAIAPAIVTAQSCAEAARFGVATANPSTAAPGDDVTITADFTCSFSRGIVPEWVEYKLEVVQNNNGFEAPILLARHQFAGTSASPFDVTNVTIPHASYVDGATYTPIMYIIYPTSGTDGSPVDVQGGVNVNLKVQTSS
ncbi:hypothetical protein PUNSTDRAFT_116082 [Punctularia strigosozonata HHB-11173 SS5]|uniref:Uncharacterized protein n=1 Tax=Punctularia strigosozonata (strain HHB-11173) TaxID=741275 RepID=R7S4M6_PUNST|nr:uncharacterized protein PUNSTDRAFT_116082 [Punctularia strigosozonata HHB-11173 SS5]EIN05188.1 hypothetical protein PUNSTDRAFT_116082 [Punctularia strigosozonata HHB-11173 SS5]